jgi:3-isopropylmalate dehydrogenase
VAVEVAADYPEVELEHMLVDACGMRIIQNPKYLDVLVTENTFGDILTDEASMLGGSLGMLASASLAGVPEPGSRTQGMYEPSYGSAPRRARQDLANPIATIASMAMMLSYSLGLADEAEAVEKAIAMVLDEGYRTYDIMGEGKTKVGTSKMGDLIAERI